MDWYSSIDATALLTSLPRTGYRENRWEFLGLMEKQLTRTFATFGLCETLSNNANDDSRFDNADRDNPIPGHLVTIAPRTIYKRAKVRVRFPGLEQ